MAGIYIHFPFCMQKCFYCDFYSVTDLSQITSYIDYLKREITLKTSDYTSKPSIDTIFIGGGTPTLMQLDDLASLINSLHEHFNISPDAEFSIECNPGAADSAYFKEYLNLGINRISIGVQSFLKKELEFLQRIHSPEEAVRTLEDAARSGFDNINIDLIYSLPGQSTDSWNYSLSRAIVLDVAHISAYNLIYEEGTPLHRLLNLGEVMKNSEETDARLFELTLDRLEYAGYEHYEVSNYARPGKKCRHNLNYWDCGEYFGFGPSAHEHLGSLRHANVKSLVKYKDMIDHFLIPTDFEEVLSREDKIREKIILAIRAEGLNMNEFAMEFRFDLKEKINPLLENLKTNGLVTDGKNMIKLTRKGYLLCDEISLRIIEEVEK